jgi:glycosyltransferase involved in cell wall biosynthesis
MSRPLILVSKSPWQPSIRREHALARIAAAKGHPVVFVEAPVDIRRPVACVRIAAARHRSIEVEPGIRVVSRTAIAPGHRSATARFTAAIALRRVARYGSTSATIVVMTPWDWSAASRIPAARRVFDCADDWRRLMLRKRGAMERLYRRAASEADAVVCVNEELAEIFTGCAVAIVPNATDDALVAAPADEAQPRTLCYVGTFSERFDTELVADVMRRLPDWHLDLYGPCRYAGRGDEPAPELRELLNTLRERVAWHGPIARPEIAQAIDRAQVFLVAHRDVGAVGGSGMKFYDVMARGRPIVASSHPYYDQGRPHRSLLDQLGVRIGQDADEIAAAILAAQAEDTTLAVRRRAWAAAQTWTARWDQWCRVLFPGKRACA